MLRKRAVWRLLIVAWLAIGILMTVLEEWVFAGTSYLIGVFYICLELWLWRRGKKLEKATSDAGGRDAPAGSA